MISAGKGGQSTGGLYPKVHVTWHSKGLPVSVWVLLKRERDCVYVLVCICVCICVFYVFMCICLCVFACFMFLCIFCVCVGVTTIFLNRLTLSYDQVYGLF